MKNLKQYIREKLIIFHPQLDEKLIVNKNYKNIINHEDKEFNYTELPEFILDNFAVYSMSRINDLDLSTDNKIIKINTLSDERYNELHDELLQLFKDNNINNVHARNISFYGDSISIRWLPEETQKSYNDEQIIKWPDDSHRLFATNNFYIWYDTESVNNTIQIMYWRSQNNITLYCKIHY